MAEGMPILLQKDNTFTKLFVGGLPYHTNDDTLKAFFLQYGEIEEAVVIYDRTTGKSKGYGFVTMATKEGAECACANPNPIVDGRKANVNLAYLGAKPKNHSQPASPLDLATAGDSSSNLSAFIHQFSPPAPLPLALQAQGFFLPPPPPHMGYYEGSPPPFSPPPPHMFPPFMYPPYLGPPYSPTAAGVGYIPPQLSTTHQVSPMVPYNAAN